MTWQELGQSVKRAGFGGVDLTVRDEGHVLPSRVVEDLPGPAFGGAIFRARIQPKNNQGLAGNSDPHLIPQARQQCQLRLLYFRGGDFQLRREGFWIRAKNGCQVQVVVDLMGGRSCGRGVAADRAAIGRLIRRLTSLAERLDIRLLPGRGAIARVKSQLQQGRT